MPVDVGTLAKVQWTRPAGHTVTLAVIKPDGTTLTPAPTVDETVGAYSAPLPCDFAGRYVLRWTDTTEAATFVDVLEVWPEDPRFLISLEAAAEALQWRPPDIAKNGDRLRLYIAAATEVIEDIAGAILGRTVVQPSDGGRTGVALWERPTDVVSVTVNGTVTTDYIVNVNAAIVYAKPAGTRFADGIQNVIVTYRTGGQRVPASIQLGTAELVRHLWQVGQQSSTGSPVESTTQDPRQTSLTRSGFAVPNRVIELIGNHHALPGTA